MLKVVSLYSKTCLKGALKKKTKILFQDCLIWVKVLQRSILQYLWTSLIKLPFVFKTFVLSIFEWPLKTGSTVYNPEKRGILWVLKNHGKIANRKQYLWNSYKMQN